MQALANPATLPTECLAPGAFQRAITRRFDGIGNDITLLKVDTAVLKHDVSLLKTDVTVLKQDVSELKTDVAVLKSDVKGLKTDVAEIKLDQNSFRHEVVSEFKAIRRDMRGDFRLLFSALITVALGLTAVMAKGFHWL